mgnify:FL=1
MYENVVSPSIAGAGGIAQAGARAEEQAAIRRERLADIGAQRRFQVGLAGAEMATAAGEMLPEEYGAGTELEALLPVQRRAAPIAGLERRARVTGTIAPVETDDEAIRRTTQVYGPARALEQEPFVKRREVDDADLRRAKIEEAGARAAWYKRRPGAAPPRAGTDMFPQYLRIARQTETEKATVALRAGLARLSAIDERQKEALIQWFLAPRELRGPMPAANVEGVQAALRAASALVPTEEQVTATALRMMHAGRAGRTAAPQADPLGLR